MTGDNYTKCIRCDTEVKQEPLQGLTLTFNQEAGAVKACKHCERIVRQRDYWGHNAY